MMGRMARVDSNFFHFNSFKLKTFFFLSLLLSVCVVSAEEDVIELGGKKGWAEVSSKRNITTTKGLYGFDALELLASPEVKNVRDCDLFLSFDGDVSKDNLKLYEVTASNARYIGKDRAKYGTGSLFCKAHLSPSLVLTPKENAFFFGKKRVTSFTIEFWLCPFELKAGSTIIKWWSQILEKNSFMFQNIAASIVENRLEWSFFNIFRDEKNIGLDIKIQSKKSLALDKWSHHLVTYDDETGLLEYRIDGHIDSVQYLSASKKETNNIFYSMKGKTAQLFIGDKYSGLIDNLIVKNEFSPQTFMEARGSFANRYSRGGGRVVSKIIDTKGVGSIPKMLEVQMDKMGEAEVAFFVRTSNTPYNWTENSPKWKAIREDVPLSNCDAGRFFQIAFNMYPTKDGSHTPIVHSVNLIYERDAFAKPPITLIAQAGDGYVDLEWSRSIDFDVKGYLVFFGDEAGQYIFPSSPLDAKESLKMRIYNLENGKLYFFSVAAYDENGTMHQGEFSGEVWARPMQK